ncbi:MULTISPECIES: MFS transporter [unclassified Rhodococcus (in: high G+C Gram-positive bacteria)]|uniref:MFS transporter n=1 Tax=unclassified Rhodococcus (in: high G+C Gram-positive bacteria) TaxID=192944 RepID=UPI00163965FF|nr:MULTISPECIES: MFS transporter [unclassified Rhodococcus (in: high G+C Gram-positive bacteria)]MBC2640404.1 MFS transporter [Rhodococcus sp. 3A]MBC2894850.1 MFS transporter [Rhodococcus sp. 4CII]
MRAGLSRDPEKADSGAFAVVGFLIVMEFGSGLLQGWYPPLLASIGEAHDVSAAALNWVNVVFLLTSVAFVPIIAKLGDIYGHRRMLVVAAALVAVGSLLVALAPTFGLLLAGRVLQAPLIAFLPLEFAIVRDRDQETAGRNIAYLVGSLTAGVLVGGLVSGAMMTTFENLTLVLLVPAVMMLVCVPTARFLVRETVARSRATVDWKGAILLASGLLALLSGVSNGNSLGWSDPLIVMLIVGGTVVLVVWVLVECRVTDPLVDFAVMARGRLVLPVVIAALIGAQIFGSQAPTALFMRSDPDVYGFGLGVSASFAGTLLAVNAAGAFLGSTLSDRIARASARHHAIALGAVLTACAYTLMIVVPASAPVFSVYLFLQGFGIGILVGLVPAVIVDRAPSDSVGIASGIYNTSRTGAGSIAGAIFALVMSSMLTTVDVGGVDKTVSSLGSYHAVWATCAAICVAIAVLALFLNADHRRDVDTSETDVRDTVGL